MNYYQRLRDMRNDRDLNQADIAKVLEIGQSDYSKYERGVNMMGIDKYIKLAKFYNVSIDYLAGITDKPKTLDGSPYIINNTTVNGNVNKLNINN